MVQDEGRFGRVNIPKLSWAPARTRPEVPKQIVRESFYVYSAIEPATGQIIYLILPFGNTEMMNMFLKEVSEAYKNKVVIMQIDGAGWHRSKALKVPENIYFIMQPAYSPELNPTEHLWEELKEKYLHNRVFNSINDTIEQVYYGLKDLEMKRDYIKSMTQFPHLNIVF
jgi:transposase